MKWNVLHKYINGEDVVESILKSRDIKNIQEFLNPFPIQDYIKDFPLDFRQGLLSSKNLIEESISNNLPIVIFGDYDSDGVNATAIIFNYLKKERGYEKTFYFIPNRFEHSYGISKEAIDDVLNRFNYPQILFITVDLGVTAYEEVKYLKDMGHKVIITDHHQKPDQLPKSDCLLWSDKICGSVISWILAKVLGSSDNKSIALAALATVTDVQEVLGINRSILKKGLEVFNLNPPLGLKKLIEVSGKSAGEITSYDLGWVLGPRLNASGRLEDATDSLKILIEDDEQELLLLAQKINEKNSLRQDKTLEMYEIASGIDQEKKPKIIFSYDESYHEGVIGLVASRLVQKYYRPSVVIALNDTYGKGSVRSITGVDIISMLRKHEDLFIDLGGHPMAAGFTIDRKNIEILENQLQKDAEEQISEDLLIPEMNIDMEIPVGMVDYSLAEKIDLLKPFGVGNSNPVFMSCDIGVTGIDTVGREMNHIRLSLYDGIKYYKAIFFSGADKIKDVSFGDKIDLVYTLKKNEYNGNKYVDLVVSDLRKA